MNLIDHNHPSFGCQRAWFLFGILGSGRSVTKMLLVEAKSPWAVQTIERLLMKDNSVSDNCVALLVHRDDPDIGIRAEIVEEISYVDFMLDVVEPRRLLADSLIATSLRNSLTAEERAHASRKLEAMTSASRCVPEPVVAPPRPVVAPPRPSQKPMAPSPAPASPSNKEAYEQLSGGLIHLGFKKAEVKKFVDGLGNRLGTEPLNDLIRVGIRELSAA